MRFKVASSVTRFSAVSISSLPIGASAQSARLVPSLAAPAPNAPRPTSPLTEEINNHPQLGKGVPGFCRYHWRGFVDKTDGDDRVIS
jgi:hypothetical protein